MDAVTESLATMGTGQVLLAIVFLASYALALGGFVGARARMFAVATAICSAGSFAACSRSWEAGLVLIAFVPLGMGLLAAAAWALWQVATWHAQPTSRHQPAPAEGVPHQGRPHTLLARARARLGFI
jgi:hypothetical protein